MTPLVVPGLGVAFTAPWGLASGALAATALVALHAVTVGRPRPAWLPTARFAPERPPRAARQLRRPSDLWLLAARVLAALAAGAALARPVLVPERRAVARVVLADRSPAASSAAVRAAALAALAPGDALVPFDATPSAPLVLAPTADSAALRRQVDSALAAGRPAGGGAASLSAALVAARRLAPSLAAGADSLELVLVSPLLAEAADAATPLVRATWAGRARVVRVATRGAARAAADGSAPRTALRAARPAVALRGGPGDDALAAALALAGVPAGSADAPVRVARGGVTAADRAWVRAAAPGIAGGRVLVDWPAGGAPAGARSAGTPDTAHALVAGGAGRAAVAVAPFVRRATFDTVSDAGAAGGARVVARWADGRPAAFERPAGAGCERLVAVAVPQAGDAALRAGFRAVLLALLGPCGGARDLAPLPPAVVAQLAGRGPLLAAAPLRAQLAPPAPDRLGAALLGVALLALTGELALRRALRTRAPRTQEAGDAAAAPTMNAPGAPGEPPSGGGRTSGGAAPGRARAA